MWTTRELTQKSEILAYLETNRLYAAYAIGDLEPGMFERCKWAGAEETGQLQALVLLFLGLESPPLFLMGKTNGLRAILENVPYPRKVYLTCRMEHLATTRSFFDWEETVAMWRMVLQPACFRPVQAGCVRLLPRDLCQLSALYDLGGGMAFDIRQVEHGVFSGIFVSGQLVAAAGTHLVSPTYSVAAVGNVFTHPDHRGQGYGRATTSAVVAELLQRGIRDVILNVSQENLVAIGIYERLGFERYCAFLEGLAIENTG